MSSNFISPSKNVLVFYLKFIFTQFCYHYYNTEGKTVLTLVLWSQNVQFRCVVVCVIGVRVVGFSFLWQITKCCCCRNYGTTLLMLSQISWPPPHCGGQHELCCYGLQVVKYTNAGPTSTIHYVTNCAHTPRTRSSVLTLSSTRMVTLSSDSFCINCTTTLTNTTTYWLSPYRPHPKR